MKSNELRVGEYVDMGGIVTTLDWIGARAPNHVEERIGYGPGRLAAGYYILVLKQTLTASDFWMFGNTLRSDGRLGNPSPTPEDDKKRLSVHELLLKEYGDTGYANLRAAVLRGIPMTGPKRLAKVYPITGHDAAARPDEQYPPGGGALQWKLQNACTFLVALKVDSEGFATGTGVSGPLGPGAHYDERARINRYLESA